MEQKIGKKGWLKTGYIDRLMQTQQNDVYTRGKKVKTEITYNAVFFLKCGNESTKINLVSSSPMQLENGDLISVFGIGNSNEACYNYNTKDMIVLKNYVSFIMICSIIPSLIMFFIGVGFAESYKVSEYLIGYTIFIALFYLWFWIISYKFKANKLYKKADYYIANFEHTLNKLGASKDSMDYKELEKHLLAGLESA